MKILTLTLLLLASLTGAAEIRVSWTTNTLAEGVTNYCVWKAVGTNDFVRASMTANNFMVLTNLPRGVVQVRVTALGANGESAPSDTWLFLAAPVPPSRPVVTDGVVSP